MRVVIHGGFVLLLVVAACAGCGNDAGSRRGGTTARIGPPSEAEVMNATYRGVVEAGTPITLDAGQWRGDPVAPGSDMRPEVQVAGRTDLRGDLDGDGVPEAIAFLTASTGATGARRYVAVVSRQKDGTLGTATAPVGDGVAVRAMHVEGGQLVLEVVQFGEGDPMCCPGELATRKWTLADMQLREAPAQVTGRLAPEVLGGTEWVLRYWDADEPAPVAPEVTLIYREGQFVGNSGCNHYSAAVTAGPAPGDLSVNPSAGTRKACRDSVVAVEARFLQHLGKVKKFGFVVGRLALPYEHEGEYGTMLFERRY